MKATLFTTDFRAIEVKPEDGKHFHLKELYNMLQCDLVEVVYLDHESIMIVDEEGKFRHEPVVNVTATLLALEKNAIHPNDVIVGHALVCDSSMFE